MDAAADAAGLAELTRAAFAAAPTPTTAKPRPKPAKAASKAAAAAEEEEEEEENEEESEEESDSSPQAKKVKAIKAGTFSCECGHRSGTARSLAHHRSSVRAGRPASRPPAFSRAKHHREML